MPGGWGVASSLWASCELETLSAEMLPQSLASRARWAPEQRLNVGRNCLNYGDLILNK